MDLSRWTPILVLLIIAGVLARAPFLAALSTALLFILGAANWWKERSLRGVVYRRKFHYTRAFPGESFPLEVIVENRKLLPLSWLRVQDPWPKAVGPVDEDTLAPSHIQDQGYLVNLLSLRWYERARRRYQLLFRKRGVYPVGPVRLESGDLFGIFQQDGLAGKAERLTVFPRLIPLERLDLPAEYPFGDRRAVRRLFEDPNRPMGVRAYHPEDDFRRVHWPATARAGELQVKVYQPVTAQVLMICLNVATSIRPWEGISPAMQEHLLSLAATLATQGINNGHRVGLIANGCLANSDQPFRIQPGRSPLQLAHLLSALAGVTPLVTAPFERFLLREMPRIPFGATLVILTAVTSPELAETLLHIKQHERRVALISLAAEPPPVIPGIHTLHRPFVEPNPSTAAKPFVAAADSAAAGG